MTYLISVFLVYTKLETVSFLQGWPALPLLIIWTPFLQKTISPAVNESGLNPDGDQAISSWYPSWPDAAFGGLLSDIWNWWKDSLNCLFAFSLFSGISCPISRQSCLVPSMRFLLSELHIHALDQFSGAWFPCRKQTSLYSGSDGCYTAGSLSGEKQPRCLGESPAIPSQWEVLACNSNDGAVRELDIIQFSHMTFDIACRHLLRQSGWSRLLSDCPDWSQE